MNEPKVEKQPPVPPFVRFVASAVPMVFDNSLSYYEALSALWKYIQDTVDVVNHNADITEEQLAAYNELKNYVDTYFDNLDLQSEVNTKLDEMVEDGTLASLINIDVVNQAKDEAEDLTKSMLQRTPTQYCEATLVKALGVPSSTGAYAQAMCYGNSTWFVLYTDSSNNMIVRKYNSDFTNLISETTLTVSGHGNSMCYFNGELYIANYTDQDKVNVIDATTLALNRTITWPYQIRSFAIGLCETRGNQILVSTQRYSSGQTRNYAILPDGSMQQIEWQQSEYNYAYRNGSKIFNDRYNNNRTFIATCIGNNSDAQIGNLQGNTIEITFYGNAKHYAIGVLNCGAELQDIELPNNSNGTYYIINSAGNVYTIQPNLWTNSVELDFLIAGVKDNTPRLVYSASNINKMKSTGTYDTFVSGGSSVDVCTSFVVPIYAGELYGVFESQGNTKTVNSAMESVNTDTYIDVPLSRMHGYNNVLYTVQGYLRYTGSVVNLDNQIGSTTQVIKYTLNACDVRLLKQNLTNSTIISFYRYQTYSELKTVIQNDGIGFILGNTYPKMLYSPLPMMTASGLTTGTFGNTVLGYTPE